MSKTPYQDVIFWEKKGYWRDIGIQPEGHDPMGNEAPDWAKKMGDQFGIAPSSAMIRKWSYEQEIIRLRKLTHSSYMEGMRTMSDESIEREGIEDLDIESWWQASQSLDARDADEDGDGFPDFNFYGDSKD